MANKMCTETVHSFTIQLLSIFSFSNRRTGKCDLKIKKFRGKALISISSSFWGFASCVSVSKQTNTLRTTKDLEVCTYVHVIEWCVEAVWWL